MDAAPLAPPEILTPRDPRWHALRQRGIGSSETPALFGCGFTGETPMAVYLAKVTPPEVLAAQDGTSVQRRGSKLERWLAEELADRHGWTLARVPTQLDQAGDPLVSSVDYLVLGDDGAPHAFLECKTANYRTLRWGDPEVEPDGVPQRVLLQVEHQMEVGVDWKGVRVFPRLAYVGACVKHIDDVRTYQVQWNEGIGKAIRDRARRFFAEHVAPRVPPAWDGSEAGDSLLAMLFPEVKGEAPTRIAPSDPVCTTMAELRLARAAKDAAEASADALAQAVKARCGEAPGLSGPGWHIRWKQNKPSTKVDYQNVAVDLFGLLGEHVGVPAAGKALDEAIRKHTSSKPGARPFVPSWDDE